MPRAGIGVPPSDGSPDLEVDFTNWDHITPSEYCVCGDTLEFEYHSGFGYKFVDFDGTSATFSHLIAVFDEDTSLVGPDATDTLSVEQSS